MEYEDCTPTWVAMGRILERQIGGNPILTDIIEKPLKCVDALRNGKMVVLPGMTTTEQEVANLLAENMREVWPLKDADGAEGSVTLQEREYNTLTYENDEGTVYEVELRVKRIVE